jgi:hypothetical protein
MACLYSREKLLCDIFHASLSGRGKRKFKKKKKKKKKRLMKYCRGLFLRVSTRKNTTFRFSGIFQIVFRFDKLICQSNRLSS